MLGKEVRNIGFFSDMVDYRTMIQNVDKFLGMGPEEQRKERMSER